jgi:ATP-dependent helicase HrpA
VHEHDIAIFPGSCLFASRPSWVLFHEIVETKRLYGRTAAAIEPRWIEQVFRDRCSYSWHDSRFDEDSGTVRAREEVTLEGLALVRNRQVDLAGKDRAQAHAVFIRDALVDERAGDSWRFLAHNRHLRARIDLAERKLRTRALYAGNDMLETFYAERLPDVCSLSELGHTITRAGNDGFLCAREEDLLAEPIPAAVDELPDTISVAGTRLRCQWVYAPQQDDDGVTIEVPKALADDVPRALWGWLIPAMNRRRVEHLICVLKKRLWELPGSDDDLVQRILDALTPEAVPFMGALRDAASATVGVPADEGVLSADEFPAHLWPRIVVRGADGNVCAVFRAGVEPLAPPQSCGMRASRWAPWCTSMEHDGAIRWEFGSIPLSTALQVPGLPIAPRVYPGLNREEGMVALRVFWSPEAAQIAHAEAVYQLLESTVAEELAWNLRTLKASPALMSKTSAFTSSGELEQTLLRLTSERVLNLPAELPRSKMAFDALAASAMERIPLAAQQALGLIDAVADGYAHCLAKLEKAVSRYRASATCKEFADQLYDAFEGYVGMLFDPAVSVRLVDGLPRYLLAFEGRIETAFLNPQRYRTAMADIGEFHATLQRLRTRPDAAVPSRRMELQSYAMWIEELAVAQFGRDKVKPLVSVTAERLTARGQELLNTR